VDPASVDSTTTSLDVEQLTEQLKDAGLQQRDASLQDISSNLIRTSLSVLKLEKRTRIQKVGVLCVSAVHRG